ncbi:MAG: carboxypeptidase-like regulatory domain-containing protein [Bacteroidales bacterium]
MKTFCWTIIFLLFDFTILSAQETITKTVIDGETGNSVVNAHVYMLDALRTGTVTNRDGVFTLKSVADSSVLKISHIAYVDFIKPVSKMSSDTIVLKTKSNNLEEVVVRPRGSMLTGRALINNVIDSLERNHYVEPVMYQVYVRVSEFEQDYSELHVLSEYVFDVYQDKRSKSEIQMLKTRAKPFSKAGRKYFKDMRMISAISINADNIFRFQDDIFKRRKLKHFEFSIHSDQTNRSDDLIALHCLNNRDNERYVLFIDKESYAISKMVKYYTDTDEEFLEIGFKKVNNKWYLDYSNRKRHSDLFSKWMPNSNAIFERKVIYNVDANTQYDKEVFKTAFDLVAEPIKRHLGDWSDDFWKDYNFVPLPTWIKAKIDKENKE